MYVLSGQEIKDCACKSIPLNKISLFRVKFNSDPVLPGVNVNLSSGGDQPVIKLVLDIEEKKRKKWQTLEFDHTLCLAEISDVAVPVSFLLYDPAGLEVALNVWLNKNAELSIHRASWDSHQITVYLSIDYFRTMLICDLSELSDFIEQVEEPAKQKR